jgi:hypothetical protein
MNTLLISPKNDKELQLLSDLFSKMKIKTKILSFEEKEDLYLGQLMLEADRNEKVSKETIMKTLGK